MKAKAGEWVGVKSHGGISSLKYQGIETMASYGGADRAGGNWSHAPGGSIVDTITLIPNPMTASAAKSLSKASPAASPAAVGRVERSLPGLGFVQSVPVCRRRWPLNRQPHLHLKNRVEFRGNPSQLLCLVRSQRLKLGGDLYGPPEQLLLTRRQCRRHWLTEREA